MINLYQAVKSFNHRYPLANNTQRHDLKLIRGVNRVSDQIQTNGSTEIETN